MKNKNEIAVIIFARLNSERIPQKMIRPFANTSLIEIALKKLLALETISRDNMYLFAHEEELTSVAKRLGVNVLERSNKSANAESCLQEIHEWHSRVDYKYVVTFNACVPFLETSTIDSFITHYMKSSHEGLFGVIEKKNYFWDEKGNLLTLAPEAKQAPNTKTAAHVYEAAHTLYASKVEWIKEGIWLGSFQKQNDPELFLIEEKETFDIDYPWQFEYAEAIYKAKNKV